MTNLTPFGPPDWPALLRHLDGIELAWTRSRNEIPYARDDAVPYMPYMMPRFIALLADAVMAAPPAAGGGPASFLDVGCGVGTKVIMARELFGLTAYGFDISRHLIAEARLLGATCHVEDAFEYEGYPAFQIVYVNQPSQRLAELEGLVMDRMADGAVLIAVNWRGDPAQAGFEVIAQEEGGGPVCGVWRKPRG